VSRGNREDIVMGTVLLSRIGKGIALATAAALLLTAVEPQLAQARPASSTVAESGAAASTATDISARKRHRHYRHHSGNAAGLAFMGLALGTVGAIAADQRRRDYYRDQYYYGGSPYYGRHYYGGPAYYGRPYYGY